MAICTIEKANLAINRLVQRGRLGELCCVIIDVCHQPPSSLCIELASCMPDPRRARIWPSQPVIHAFADLQQSCNLQELHMVACPHRGLALELSLVKLLQSSHDIQIIGMSATMGGEAVQPLRHMSLLSQLASVTALVCEAILQAVDSTAGDHTEQQAC